MEKTPDIKFGTDGWRGVMARDFTFENVRRVAQAIADYVKDETEKNPKRKPPFEGQAPRAGFPGKPQFNGDRIEHGFGKPAAVVISGTEK